MTKVTVRIPVPRKAGNLNSAGKQQKHARPVRDIRPALLAPRRKSKQ